MVDGVCHIVLHRTFFLIVSNAIAVCVWIIRFSPRAAATPQGGSASPSIVASACMSLPQSMNSKTCFSNRKTQAGTTWPTLSSESYALTMKIKEHGHERVRVVAKDGSMMSSKPVQFIWVSALERVVPRVCKSMSCVPSFIIFLAAKIAILSSLVILLCAFL